MEKKYEELVGEKPNIIIWGTGKTMEQYIKRIDPSLNIRFFADSYSHKWGKLPAAKINCSYKDLPCKTKDDINQNDVVLIAIKALSEIEIVEKELNQRGIDYCHIIEAVHAYTPELDRLQIEKFERDFAGEKEFDEEHIIKFINCHVPYLNCNMRCSYCYIRQVRDFKKGINYFHTPEFIRASLSKRRLGGVALINFCAGGETLMCRELVPIITELIKEGHYISIVTNGTISKAFDNILESGIDLEHIFIKFSYHYLELKRLRQLEAFVNNVNRMRKAGCSVSVELSPSDDLVPYIEEIKEFSLNKLGALPHLTVLRDDTDTELKILTKYAIEEYKSIWKEFQSELFSFKIKHVFIKRLENCMAGKWSFQMNLETGDIHKCIGNPYIGNIYEDLCKDIYLEPVANSCCLPYCYNNHVYLTLGLIEELETPTYYEVRDRELKDKSHWVHGKIKNVYKQKLYENN